MVISALNGRQKVVPLFLTLAIAWSSALIVLALVLHQPTSTSGDVGSYEPVGTRLITSMTLVQENGPKVLIPVGLPLVLSLCVAMLMLSHYRRRPLANAGVWVCAGLLLALSLLGILSVGLFILPVAVFVVLAAAYASP
jgi:hypothetical protein